MPVGRQKAVDVVSPHTHASASPSPRSVLASAPMSSAPSPPHTHGTTAPQQMPPPQHNASQPAPLQTVSSSSSSQFQLTPPRNDAAPTLTRFGDARHHHSTKLVDRTPVSNLCRAPGQYAPHHASPLTVATGACSMPVTPVHSAQPRPPDGPRLSPPPSRRLLSALPPASIAAGPLHPLSAQHSATSSESDPPRPGTTPVSVSMQSLIHDLYRSVLTERPSQPLPFIVSRLQPSPASSPSPAPPASPPMRLSSSSASPTTQTAASSVVADVCEPGVRSDLGELSPPSSVGETFIGSGEGESTAVLSPSSSLSARPLSAKAIRKEGHEAGEAVKGTGEAGLTATTHDNTCEHANATTPTSARSRRTSNVTTLSLSPLMEEVAMPSREPRTPTDRRQEVDEVVASPPPSRFTCPTAATPPPPTHAVEGSLSSPMRSHFSIEGGPARTHGAREPSVTVDSVAHLSTGSVTHLAHDSDNANDNATEGPGSRTHGVSVLPIVGSRPPSTVLPLTRPPLYPQAVGEGGGFSRLRIQTTGRLPDSASASSRLATASPPTTLVIPHAPVTSARLTQSRRTSGSGSSGGAVDSVDGDGGGRDSHTNGLDSRQTSDCSLDLISIPQRGSTAHSGVQVSSARSTHTTWALRPGFTLSQHRAQGPSSATSSRLSTPCATTSLMSTFGGAGGGNGGASRGVTRMSAMGSYPVSSPLLTFGALTAGAGASVGLWNPSSTQSQPSITVIVGAAPSACSAESSFASSGPRPSVPSVELAAFVRELRQVKEELVGQDQRSVTFDTLCDVLERAAFSAMDVQLLAALFDDLQRPVLEAVQTPTKPRRPPLSPHTVPAQTADGRVPSSPRHATAAGSLGFDDVQLSPISSRTSQQGVPDVDEKDELDLDRATEPTVVFDAYVARVAHLIAGKYPNDVLHRAFREIAALGHTRLSEDIAPSSVPGSRCGPSRVGLPYISSFGACSTTVSPLLPLALRDGSHQGFLPSLHSPGSSTHSLFVLHRATSLLSSPFNAGLAERVANATSAGPDVTATTTTATTSHAHATHATGNAMAVPLSVCVVEGLQKRLGIRGLTGPVLSQALVELGVVASRRSLSDASWTSAMSATGAAACVETTQIGVSDETLSEAATPPLWWEAPLTLNEFSVVADHLAMVTENLWKAELASRQGTPGLTSMSNSATRTGRAGDRPSADELDDEDAQTAQCMDGCVGYGDEAAAGQLAATARAVSRACTTDRVRAADAAGAAAVNASCASLPESIGSGKGAVSTVTVGTSGQGAARR